MDIPLYTHTASVDSYCRWCSTPNSFVFHYGPCPRVKSIEYYQNGAIKKVEFNDTEDSASFGGNQIANISWEVWKDDSAQALSIFLTDLEEDE